MNRPDDFLRERSPRQCLACDSTDTTIHGRTLRCRKCEVVYLVPAVQLARTPVQR